MKHYQNGGRDEGERERGRKRETLRMEERKSSCCSLALLDAARDFFFFFFFFFIAEADNTVT